MVNKPRRRYQGLKRRHPQRQVRTGNQLARSYRAIQRTPAFAYRRISASLLRTPWLLAVNFRDRSNATFAQRLAARNL